MPLTTTSAKFYYQEKAFAIRLASILGEGDSGARRIYKILQSARTFHIPTDDDSFDLLYKLPAPPKIN